MNAEDEEAVSYLDRVIAEAEAIAKKFDGKHPARKALARDYIAILESMRDSVLEFGVTALDRSLEEGLRELQRQAN